MAETVYPGPVSDLSAVREATCIHTKKIFDSCQSKDCIEDLRLYPTQSSQPIIDQALSVKAGRARLLYTLVNVEPMGLNRGFFTGGFRADHDKIAPVTPSPAAPVRCRSAVWQSLISGPFSSEARAPQSPSPPWRAARS